MPTYSFICRTCGRPSEVYASVSMLPAIEAEAVCCGLQMDYNWTHSGRHVPFKAFSTQHILGPGKAPIEIDSLATLRKVERQYNVNWPAYGGSMLGGNIGQPESHWRDDVTQKLHRD